MLSKRAISKHALDILVLVLNVSTIAEWVSFPINDLIFSENSLNTPIQSLATEPCKKLSLRTSSLIFPGVETNFFLSFSAFLLMCWARPFKIVVHITSGVIAKL